MTASPVESPAAEPGLPPLAVVPSEDRSTQGVFSREGEDSVLDNLLKDLASKPGTINKILTRYRQNVSDRRRRSQATRTLHDAADGRLTDAGQGLARLTEILYFAGYHRLLGKYFLLYPGYDVLEEYFVNTSAPVGPVVTERPVVDGRTWTFLGRDIGFPIGVPASVLTCNSQWISHLARNGFNVLTYKTVRSRKRSANYWPNWIFLSDVSEPLPLNSDIEARQTLDAEPTDWIYGATGQISTVNSFGVPSTDPSEWAVDLKEAFHFLHEDQILIVSVLGDRYDEEDEEEDVIRDFIDVARIAEDAGAEFIELNLSCPNSLDTSGKLMPILCEDPELSATIVAQVRLALKPTTRLLIKLGYLPYDQLRNLMLRVGNDVDAVAGINTVSYNIRARGSGRGRQPHPRNAFPNRKTAGVSGLAIRNYALDFISSLSRIRAENGFDYQIIGMGGVTDADSFAALYDVGAHVVQSASGTFGNPLLALQCADQLGESLSLVPPAGDSGTLAILHKTLLDYVPTDRFESKYEIATKIPYQPSVAFAGLHDLVAVGAVEERGTGFDHSFKRK